MSAFVAEWQRTEEKGIAGCVTVNRARPEKITRYLPHRFTLGAQQKLDNLPLAAS